VKTLEDFATCADWELAGGWTTVGGERVKDDGLLEPFDVSLEEAQNMVMTARVKLGWVDHRGTRGASRRRGEAARRSRRSRRGRGRGLRPLARAGHRDDAGRPEKGSGRRPERRCIVTATCSRNRGCPLRGFPGRGDRAGHPGKASRSRHLGQRRPDAIETAVKKNLFARAAKAKVTVPEDLADRVEAGLPGGSPT
jgi:hypothetical protein